MLLAQLTDLHIGFDGPDKPDGNTNRFAEVISHVKSLTVSPDAIIISGDIVETGQNWAYARVKDMCSAFDMPVYFAMGNHDSRDDFEHVFGTGLMTGGFVQYTIETFEPRIIVLDTLEPGRHGGSFCERRAQWLSEKLSEQPERPTILVLHHPPIPTGLGWMTASPRDGWVMNLKAAIAPYDNIVQILSGHIHRPISRRFENSFVSVSRAVAPPIALDLAPLDPDTPDNRVLITDAPAGYSLHHWDGVSLTTHNIHLPEGNPILHYDADHAWVIRHTMGLDN